MLHIRDTKAPVQCNTMLEYNIMNGYVTVVVRPEMEKLRRLEITLFSSTRTSTVNTSGMRILKYCFRYRVAVRFVEIFW
jgi:hypothetical protein